MATKKNVKKPSQRAPLGSRLTRPKKARGRTSAAQTPFALRARDVDVDPKFGTYIQRRVGSKLGRYAPSLAKVTVRLERPSGPEGAPVFACRFSLAVIGKGKITIESTEADPRAAFDSAVDATERAVRRLLEKRQSRRQD